MIGATNIPASHGGGENIPAQKGCKNSVGGALNFAPNPGRKGTRSKRNTDLMRIVDIGKQIFSTTGIVDEGQLQTKCRQFPGDSLKALHILHRCYPCATALVIQSGLWTLIPSVTAGMEAETIAINRFRRV